MSNTVLTELVGDHVLVVKLNRPEARNAINAELAQAMERVVEESEADPAVRAVILTSTTDPVFCAGADLKMVAAGDVNGMYTDKHGFAGFVAAPRTKPWIAAVAGKALGGGLELCLACDMIVAGTESYFGLPEVRRGIFAAAGGVFRLPQVIPKHIAMQMVATGVPIPALRAYELGLVNQLAQTSDVLTTAIDLANEIALGAPFAVRESLGIARKASELTEEALWALSEDLRERIVKTGDFQEGAQAFIERREPQWSGQ
ncbi:enoyl-CoA hydratase (plasmid) [Alteromonas sp. I4]|nr:enoyl-CoA hydratase [Alteromonas sp. I4]